MPALNEEVLIEPTLSSVPGFIDRIYVVDDGSTDGTLARMREAAERDPRIITAHHEVNKGVEATIVSWYHMSLEDDLGVNVVMGSGTRASIWLMKGSRALALINGRN